MCSEYVYVYMTQLCIQITRFELKVREIVQGAESMENSTFTYINLKILNLRLSVFYFLFVELYSEFQPGLDDADLLCILML